MSDTSYEERVADALEGVNNDPMQAGIAFDLVTRQPLYIRRTVADSLAEYYESEGFDLQTYKMHAFLPVRSDDSVFECIFLSDITAESLHQWGDEQTYDFPRGRLATVPIDMAFRDVEVGDV